MSRDLVVVNKLGLHARAAAKLVQQAVEFKSEIKIRREDVEVNGKSIMGVLMLAAAQGMTITVTADGPDAEDAVEALAALVADRFGEDE